MLSETVLKNIVNCFVNIFNKFSFATLEAKIIWENGYRCFIIVCKFKYGKKKYMSKFYLEIFTSQRKAKFCSTIHEKPSKTHLK